MSKQRVIIDDIWIDEWVFDLTPTEKLVWFYLLTNSQMNIAGIYKLANAQLVSVQLGIEKKEFEKAMERFVMDEKILYEKGWIALINFHKHLTYRNENVAKGIVRLNKEMEPYTKGLKGFERVWVTLLNLTSLYLSEGDASASLVKNKKTEK